MVAAPASDSLSPPDPRFPGLRPEVPDRGKNWNL